MKIGVFDSGIGGLSIAQAIEKQLPEHKVVFRNDVQNVPYGNKTPEELMGLVLPILDKMSSECQVIVVACNTITTTIIEQLRAVLAVPLIGVEPMVQAAAGLTKSGIIAVCATPTTLESARYKWLVSTYAKTLTVLEPDCSDWSYLIETKQIDKQKVQDLINQACERGADVIVLGCTHYHWIQNVIKKAADGRAKVIQPIQSVVEELRRVLKQLA